MTNVCFAEAKSFVLGHGVDTVFDTNRNSQ